MRASSSLKPWLLALMLGLFSVAVSAETLIVVCYNWRCKDRAAVSYPDAWLRQTLKPLKQVTTPETERVAVAEVVRQFYLRAAEQTPIGADQAGNNEDDSVNGRMDCIDHSTTTQHILSYLEAHKRLRWHTVGPYAERTWLVSSHYSATLVERDSEQPEADRIYTVDPWNVDPGSLPEVASVREWSGAHLYTLDDYQHTQEPAAVALVH